MNTETKTQLRQIGKSSIVFVESFVRRLYEDGPIKLCHVNEKLISTFDLLTFSRSREMGSVSALYVCICCEFIVVFNIDEFELIILKNENSKSLRSI